MAKAGGFRFRQRAQFIFAITTAITTAICCWHLLHIVNEIEKAKEAVEIIKSHIFELELDLHCIRDNAFNN